MSKEYIVPHNYKNNGRVFNLFEKQKVNRALIIAALAVALSAIVPIPLMWKFMVGTVLVIGPALFILFGFDDLLIDILIYKKFRRIYFDIERGDDYEYWHQKTRLQKEQSTSR
ncbi:MAG: hypothetical protein PHE79_11625 [Eubacteriales bacterium]|nr:hypothetical protein [Eubacteriales bacterium]